MSRMARLVTGLAALLAASPGVVLVIVTVLVAVLFCPWREPFERLLALLHGHPRDRRRRRGRCRPDRHRHR